MNILVTGANGLLGKALLNILRLEHKIYAIVGKNSILEEKKNLSVLEMDLADLDVNELPKNIDVIYYLAQSNHFREFPDKALDMLSVNVYTPLKLALWAKQRGIKKFIYTSSGGVYKHPTEPVQEDFKINANGRNGFYLDSKLSTEILLRNFSQFFETFVIVRPFFMYGPEQNSSMLIPRLMHNIIDGNEITLSNSDGIRINPIYVDDAANSMERLLYLLGEHTFNIAGNEVVSLRELSETVGIVVNKNPKYKVLDTFQSDLIADITQMKEKLSIPRVNLEDGLLAVYEVIEN